MLDFVARLFRARKAPTDTDLSVGDVALPETEIEPAPEAVASPPEPEAIVEPPVPEPVAEAVEIPTVAVDGEPEPEPEPQPALVSLTLDEAISVAREARIDCFQLQFLAREWERKRATGEGATSDWSQLERLAEGRLRKAGFLAEQQRLELVPATH